MNAAKIISFTLMVASLCGCSVSVSYLQTNLPPHPLAAKSSDAVDVLTIPPGRKYVEIGTIQTELVGFASHENVVAAVKQEAANRGCDALVRIRSVHTFAAACIVYTEK